MDLEANKKNAIEFVRCIAEGDLVALHTHQIWPEGDAYVTMDFLRFDENGKICEHWDTIQQSPKNLLVPIPCIDMKTMICNQLGGACDMEFTANTFDEIAEMSKKHGMEMFQKQDIAHLKAMEKMKGVMQNPGAMQEWFNRKRQLFDSLPTDQPLKP